MRKPSKGPGQAAAKQPATASGFLQKPRNYVRTVQPVRAEPSMKIAPTPKGMKPPKLVK